MSSNSTLSKKGERNISVATTGSAKKRFTVALTISASGRFLPTVIQFSGLVKPPKVKPLPGIIVTASPSGVMNSRDVIRYVDMVIGGQGSAYTEKDTLLVLDSHRAHLVTEVTDALGRLKQLCANFMTI